MNSNPTLTIEEARTILNNPAGASYVATEHNKKMIKQVLDEVIVKLIADKQGK